MYFTVTIFKMKTSSEIPHLHIEPQSNKISKLFTLQFYAVYNEICKTLKVPSPAYTIPMNCRQKNVDNIFITTLSN